MLLSQLYHWKAWLIFLRLAVSVCFDQGWRTAKAVSAGTLLPLGVGAGGMEASLTIAVWFQLIQTDQEPALHSHLRRCLARLMLSFFCCVRPGLADAFPELGPKVTRGLPRNATSAETSSISCISCLKSRREIKEHKNYYVLKSHGFVGVFYLPSWVLSFHSWVYSAVSWQFREHAGFFWQSWGVMLKDKYSHIIILVFLLKENALVPGTA